VHTLALALAENGNPAEGLAWLERLWVNGQANELLPLSLEDERARLERQRRARLAVPQAIEPLAGRSDGGATTE
jgi:hypothetical protein